MKEGISINCTHTLVSVGSSLLPNKIYQQLLSHRFFATFRVLSLLEKELFHNTKNKNKRKKIKFFHPMVLKQVFMHNFMFLEICQVSKSDKTPTPGVTKLKYLLTSCTPVFTCWLGTIALLQKNIKLALLRNFCFPPILLCNAKKYHN